MMHLFATTSAEQVAGPGRPWCRPSASSPPQTDDHEPAPASAHAGVPGGASPVLMLGDQAPAARSVRVLDPIARASEVLFGLIMALTFTGTLSVATAGREEVRALLIGMVGCNLAWGLVDAVMFLISALTERGHGLLTMRAVQAAPNPRRAHRIISGAVPPVVSSLLTTADLERFRRSLQRKHDLPARATLDREDWLGALAVFLLVFLSTFPLVIPFLLFDRVHLALRVSNAIAIVDAVRGRLLAGAAQRAPSVAHGFRHGVSGTGARRDCNRPGRIAAPLLLHDVGVEPHPALIGDLIDALHFIGEAGELVTPLLEHHEVVEHRLRRVVVALARHDDADSRGIDERERGGDAAVRARHRDVVDVATHHLLRGLARRHRLFRKRRVAEAETLQLLDVAMAVVVVHLLTELAHRIAGVPFLVPRRQPRHADGCTGTSAWCRSRNRSSAPSSIAVFPSPIAGVIRKRMLFRVVLLGNDVVLAEERREDRRRDAGVLILAGLVIDARASSA